MGYETHSPIKQVWLPIDFNFIDNLDGSTYGDFKKEYLKKYGIDLDKIFELYKTDNDLYGLNIKGVVGAYATGNSDPTAFENGVFGYVPQAIVSNYPQEQLDTDKTLMRVMCGFDSRFGFRIDLPAVGSAINTIDDLKVYLEDQL